MAATSVFWSGMIELNATAPSRQMVGMFFTPRRVMAPMPSRVVMRCSLTITGCESRLAARCTASIMYWQGAQEAESSVIDVDRHVRLARRSPAAALRPACSAVLAMMVRLATSR